MRVHKNQFKNPPPTPSGYFPRKGGRRQRSQSVSFLSPLPSGERGVMLNLFQHLTNIAYDFQYCKILNSLKIAPEVKVRNYITKNDFLRFQDDNEHPSQPSCLPALNEPSDFAYAKSFALCRQAASLNRESAQGAWGKDQPAQYIYPLSH